MLAVLLVLLVAMQGVLEGASLTVEDSVTGTTPRYIGACSALSFYESDLQDLGINTYRFWTNSMQLLEWQDDDQDFGSPTSEAIRADEANGFVNTIPWDFWDAAFNRNDAWRRGTQNFNDMFSIARQNDIEPIVVLRTWENPPDGTRDELVSEFDFSGGTFSFQAPDNGIVLAQVEAVPEPGSAALVALSAAFGLFVRRKMAPRASKEHSRRHNT